VLPMWLTSLFGCRGAARRPVSRTHRRPRLCLEALEDRLTPAVALLVTDPSDAVAADGVVTLREALLAANTNTTVGDAFHDGSGGVDAITFDHSVFARPQTITLTLGELSVTDSVDITGPKAALTISGNDATRIFFILSATTTPINVDIVHLTLTASR